MSALLVLAGLWLPANKTLVNRDLPWQPIPYNYYPASEETVSNESVQGVHITVAFGFFSLKFREIFTRGQL